MTATEPKPYRIDNVREPARPDLVRKAVALWLDQNVLDATEAERRSAEILLVATQAENDEAVGIATTYLGRASALGVPMWHFRTFVAPDWRRKELGFQLLREALAFHEQQFTSGADTRGLGFYLEIENAPLRELRNEAVWPTTGLAFVGYGPRGQHCRAHFFEGARIPV